MSHCGMLVRSRTWVPHILNPKAGILTFPQKALTEIVISLLSIIYLQLKV